MRRRKSDEMTITRGRDEVRVHLGNEGLSPLIAGPAHRNLALVEDAFGVQASAQGGDIILSGADPITLEQAREAIAAMVTRAGSGEGLGLAEVRAAISFVRAGASVSSSAISLPGRRTGIKPRTPTQALYLDALTAGDNDLVFGVGPAGTGKTYLAVAVAVGMLLEGRVAKVVVTRPAVEAGERLGFLPGDLEEKVDPYLMPIWDAFKSLLGAAQLERRKAAGEIEVAPLAFMRGRTLADAFVIVDEAQNTSRMQMKMLLTRLGEGSRMAVNGDPTQVDLPRASDSGLAHALKILRNVQGMRIVTFTRQDVVRHPLVGRIVEAYEAEDRVATAMPNPNTMPFQAPNEMQGFDVEAQMDDPRWIGALGHDVQAFAAHVTSHVNAFFEPKGEGFAVLFTSDEAVKSLNAQWRGKDEPTNVLSFPAPDTAGTLGDIALAYETCAREADEQGKSLKDHATHLLVHGLLHLLGYDHEADDDAAEMEGLEKDIMASLGLEDPYIQHV
jgi:phosphate starvation-inducible protein PhoH and related proteins